MTRQDVLFTALTFIAGAIIIPPAWRGLWWVLAAIGKWWHY